MPILEVFDNEEMEGWNRFVFDHPKGSLFQTAGMKDLYLLTPSYEPMLFISYDDNKKINGGLLAHVIKPEGFKKHLAARSIIIGGPLALNDNEWIIDDLLKAYNKKIQKTSVIYSQIRNIQPLLIKSEIFERNHFEFEDHLTVIVDLKKDESNILNDMHPKRKKNILRSLKKGTYVKQLSSEDEIIKAISMIQDTYTRIKLPTPPCDLFLKSMKIFNAHISFWGAFIGEKMIGARIYLGYKNYLYDWYAGSDQAALNLHPNDILPWKVMIWAKSNGYEIYDFAGAGKPNVEYGVRDYKLKFGGNLISIGRFLHTHKPFLYEVGKMAVKLNLAR